MQYLGFRGVRKLALRVSSTWLIPDNLWEPSMITCSDVTYSITLIYFAACCALIVRAHRVWNWAFCGLCFMAWWVRLHRYTAGSCSSVHWWVLASEEPLSREYLSFLSLKATPQWFVSGLTVTCLSLQGWRCTLNFCLWSPEPPASCWLRYGPTCTITLYQFVLHSTTVSPLQSKHNVHISSVFTVISRTDILGTGHGIWGALGNPGDAHSWLALAAWPLYHSSLHLFDLLFCEYEVISSSRLP